MPKAFDLNPFKHAAGFRPVVEALCRLFMSMHNDQTPRASDLELLAAFIAHADRRAPAGGKPDA